MKRILTVAACAFALPFAGFAQDVPEDVVARINDLLAEMQCEVDAGNIEAEDGGGYELDDVFCADGQYDIELDADLQVTERRKE